LNVKLYLIYGRNILLLLYWVLVELWCLCYIASIVPSWVMVELWCLCYIASIVLNFKFGHNMNIRNVALLGNVTDGTPIEYNKLACLLVTVGTP
jgi:hypothetical protein